jgi:hypothetical protein
VEFYVPLGARGLLLGIGTFLIGILGGMAYRKAARRRELRPADPPHSLALAEILAME